MLRLLFNLEEGIPFSNSYLIFLLYVYLILYFILLTVSLISFRMIEVIFRMSDYNHNDLSHSDFHSNMGGGGCRLGSVGH
jgi:hypothetical protein